MGRAKEVIYHNGRLKGKYLDEATCNTLEKLILLDKNKGFLADLKNIIYNLHDDQIDEIIATGSNEGIEEMPIGTLRDPQTIAVAYQYFARRLIIGDSVGLGKTVEIAGFLNYMDKKARESGTRHRYLVLTENNIVPQFRRELVRFTGEYVAETRARKDDIIKFLSQYEDPEDLPNIIAPASLFNQAIFQEYLIQADRAGKFPFDTLVVDESGSVLANTKTKTYKNAEYIRNKVGNVVILNATSFESNLQMFYSQLNFVDDTFLPTKTAFQKRYCKMKRSAYANYATPTGEYKNENEFRDLVSYRYLARTRRALGAEFKDCTAEIASVPKSDIQRKMLPHTSMPQMVFDSPSYFDKDVPFDRKTTPKIGVITDALNGRVIYEGGWEDARTVLIYSFYKESQEGLSSHLTRNGISNKVMNGDTPQDERTSITKEFQQGNFRVLLTNVMKGLNFGTCNHVIVYSAPGNVNKIVQFEGRITRDYDIVDKHLLILLTEGEEEKRFNTDLSNRAKASDSFAGSDHSLILSLLL